MPDACSFFMPCAGRQQKAKCFTMHTCYRPMRARMAFLHKAPNKSIQTTVQLRLLIAACLQHTSSTHLAFVTSERTVALKVVIMGMINITIAPTPDPNRACTTTQTPCHHPHCLGKQPKSTFAQMQAIVAELQGHI